MSNLSLNKAAHLLGCNELNKFDYKSLVSIRKLAKTLGCNEYDLMKGFEQNGPISTDLIPKKTHEKFKLLRSKKIFSTKPKSKECERAFKRIIVNRKLPSKYSRTKKSHTQENDESFEEIVSQVSDTKSEANTSINQQLKTSPKREIILYKDEHLGFGFIAGSEKPLKIRFVTPIFLK
ncbi:hypothetical protein BpHYR1_001046 [Brachionus plicatilis]|uniref:Uncharacterized protein n=1 Tax=Brachionus plicatilis TaxID=10195 RepID=A0A3M7QE21_BRAPC|nr:hypothetical protein BpHYR1_001046 [Brachionus plicatilis]